MAQEIADEQYRSNHYVSRFELHKGPRIGGHFPD
jgi:hypothetical protein